MRDEAIAAFGAVDIWVNNVGRGNNASVLELTDEQFDEMMAVNVKSALYGMQAIVPHFKERGHGHLINVSSFLSRVPIATYRSAYNAAKAALNALTANLRMDLRRESPERPRLARHAGHGDDRVRAQRAGRNAVGDLGVAARRWCPDSEPRMTSRSRSSRSSNRRARSSTRSQDSRTRWRDTSGTSARSSVALAEGPRG